MVSIISYYTTKFGELWKKSLFDLVNEAITNSLEKSNIDLSSIDAIFYGNMLGGVLENNLHSAAKIAELLKINIPVFRVESACASGGMAFSLAVDYINSSRAGTVLVVGAEKMNDFAPEQITTALAAAASGEEQQAGLTFPGLYAMLARVYLETYKYSEENLAYVAVKNHFHGSLNNNSQFKNQININQVLTSPYVADPLKVLDCSPVTDGAAAVILTNNKKVLSKSKHRVPILASEVATDTISIKNRKNMTSLESARVAANKAYSKAKIKPDQISVAEVHDCFTIAEILAMEDLGFCKKGQGGNYVKSMTTKFASGGKLTVNTSGGLKAAGHPVGATGIKQIGEIYLQLTGQADRRQVKNPKYGLAHNVGGSGGTAVVTILSG